MKIFTILQMVDVPFMVNCNKLSKEINYGNKELL